LGIIVDFNTTGHLMMTYSLSYLQEMGIQQSSASAVDRLQESLDSVRKEVLCNILFDFGILMKLVRLIIMCLKETYTRVWVGKHFRICFVTIYFHLCFRVCY